MTTAGAGADPAAGAQAVLPPGQEDVVADLVGRGVALPGGCRLESAAIRKVDIVVRYQCGDQQAGATITLEDAKPSSSPPAGRLLLHPDPTMPPALAGALETRLRGGQERLGWTRPRDTSTTSREDGHRPGGGWGRWWPGVEVALGLVAMLGVVALVALSSRRWRRAARAASGPERSAAIMLGAALALAAGGHALLRGTGLVLGVAVGLDPSWMLALALLLWLAGLGVALLGVSLLRGASAWRRSAWVVAVGAAYVAGGLLLGLPPAVAPGLGGLLLPFRGSQQEQGRRRPDVTYRFNQRGFREPEFATRPAQGVRRVILIGDSYVFGSGVPLEGTLSSQLALALARRSGPPVEVLNLGVPGANLASYVDLYEAASAQLAPDVVVICLVLPNDLSRWDVQVARREALQPGFFALTRFLVGEAGAQVVWDLALLERRETPEGLGHLRDQVARLVGYRKKPSPRLLFFRYAPEAAAVDEVLSSIPDAVLVAPAEFHDADFIPGDGHPTAKGNGDFAALLADRLEREGWLAAP